jgi:hypothetical protein
MKTLLLILFCLFLATPACAATYQYMQIDAQANTQNHYLSGETVVYTDRVYLISDNTVTVTGNISDLLDAHGSINLFLYNVNNEYVYMIYNNYEGSIVDLRGLKQPIVPGVYAIKAVVCASGGLFKNNTAQVKFSNITVTSQFESSKKIEAMFPSKFDIVSAQSSKVVYHQK